MNKEKKKKNYRLQLSFDVAKIINEVKKGTNLTNSDVVEMIIKQFFLSKGLISQDMDCSGL